MTTDAATSASITSAKVASALYHKRTNDKRLHHKRQSSKRSDFGRPSCPFALSVSKRVQMRRAGPSRLLPKHKPYENTG